MSPSEALGQVIPVQPPDQAAPTVSQRKWLILAVIAIAQLMVIVDATVVNIALPSAQKALHFTSSDRQWIVTAYTLAFGSLLLLGGRLGDLLGRRRTFLIGLIGFAIASIVGGAAGSFGVLVAARACQGVFGALLAPAGLSLLITTFPGKEERGKAFGVYGAIMGSGAAVGLLLGGALTEYLSWRWCMYVNLVFAVVGILGGMLLLRKEPSAQRSQLDVPGAVLVSVALFCVVYGFSKAEAHGWQASSTWGFIVSGVVVLAAFVVRQARAANPLLPLRIVLDRNRGGSYLAVFIAMAGMSGIGFFLTYYLQVTLGYSAVASGFAYLPMIITSMFATMLANVKLLPRTGPRPLIVLGMLLAAAGSAWLTRIGLDTGYTDTVLGPLLVIGFGLGLVMSPAMNTSTFGVPVADAGVASAMANTQQQIGTSLGTALLNTIAVSSTASYLANGRPSSERIGLAQVHGYTTAFWWTAVILVAGSVLCGLLLRSGALVPNGTHSEQGTAEHETRSERR